jgi:hypothetical protein
VKKAIVFIGLLSALTAQLVIPIDLFAQPITAATPFEQLAQGQQGQSQQQTESDPNIELISARFIDDRLGGEIVGEVLNNGTADAQFVEALATFRDSASTVIGTSFGFADPHQVSAKDSAPFNILITSEIVQDQAATYDLTLQWQDMEANEFSKDVLSKQPFEYGVSSTGSGRGGADNKNGWLCYTIEIDPPLGPNETLPFPIPGPPGIRPCPGQPILNPPPSNSTIPLGPDERCLFDPTLPHCIPAPGVDCPEGFGANDDGQCFPLGGCPDGYHSNEDDESGICYPDSEPCPEGQVRSDEGNFCEYPTQPEDCADGYQFNPSIGDCEPIPDTTTPVTPLDPSEEPPVARCAAVGCAPGETAPPPMQEPGGGNNDDEQSEEGDDNSNNNDDGGNNDNNSDEDGDSGGGNSEEDGGSDGDE